MTYRWGVLLARLSALTIFATIGTIATVVPAFSIKAPDLIVKDIQISRDADNPTQLLIRFADDSAAADYQVWFDNAKRDRLDKGVPAGDVDIYVFDYDVFVDGTRIDSASSSSYLPRSGRKFVTTRAIGIFDDRATHKVTVRANPRDRDLDRDLSNNELTKKLKFIGKTINVILSRLEVRDDCDSISEGDWKLLLQLNNGSGHECRGISPVFGIDSGDVRFFRGSNVIKYEQVHNNRTLEITFHGIDCDTNGPLSLFYDPLAPILVPFFWNLSCGGEEWWEYSGPEDIAGSAFRRLAPADWHGGTSVSMTSGPSTLGSPPKRRQDCGRNAFTVDVRIEDPPISTATTSCTREGATMGSME